MTTIFDKHVWEGWTVGNFIESLKPSIDEIMAGNSWQKPFKSKAELADWCVNNQPHYKRKIPEVIKYFALMHNLK